jgi:hypothetical protein
MVTHLAVRHSSYSSSYSTSESLHVRATEAAQISRAPIQRGWCPKSASCWAGHATVPSECRGLLQLQLLALAGQREQGAELRSVGDWSAQAAEVSTAITSGSITRSAGGQMSAFASSHRVTTRWVEE